jgi:cytochrome c oxidase subunit I+III
MALLFVLAWLWTGTAEIPEKPAKDVGLGLQLPLYASGIASVGWWGMFITMLADMSAYASLVFGYFFYWTVRTDFPPGSAAGPGQFWPLLAAALLLAAWALVLRARRCNAVDRGGAFYAALGAAAGLALGGGAALFAGPWLQAMDPTAHVYPATVWVLVVWTLMHVGVGLLMLLYCLARRLAGRLSGMHDIDIRNVALYWHFLAIMAVTTATVIGLFPLVV